MSLTLQSITMPAGTEIPGSMQGIADLLVQYLQVSGLDGFRGVNFGSATPSVDDRDKPWFKTTPAGKPIGWFAWNGAEWKQLVFSITRGTTAERPVQPDVGSIYFDTDIAVCLIFERGKWRTLAGSPGDIKFVNKPTLAEAIKCNPGWAQFTNATGRVLGAAGEGVGLTARAVLDTTGTEEHTLLEEEIPTHTHDVELFKNDSRGGDQGNTAYFTNDTGATEKTVTTKSAGEGEAHNNMQPTIFAWCLYKE